MLEFLASEISHNVLTRTISAMVRADKYRTSIVEGRIERQWFM